MFYTNSTLLLFFSGRIGSYGFSISHFHKRFFAAGILIYNGIVDLLLPVFADATVMTASVLLQLFAMVCLTGGFAGMCVLSIWA